MNMIGNGITSFFNLLLLPFGSNHTVGLIVLSFLTGVLIAYLFKLTSNQKAIRIAREKLKARILEMRIYQDDPVLILRAFGGGIISNFIYVSKMLRPFVIIIIPMAVIFMQMDERYARSPLGDDADTIVSVTFDQSVDPTAAAVSLKTPPGVSVEAGPVRVKDSREVDWRVRVEKPGTHELTIATGAGTYTLPLVAQSDYKMIGRQRSASAMESLVHPALSPLSSPFKAVSVRYDGARYPFLAWDVHWIVMFLLVSLLAAVVMKFIIKIEI